MMADSAGVSAQMADGTPVTHVVSSFTLSAPGVDSICLGVEDSDSLGTAVVSRAAEVPPIT